MRHALRVPLALLGVVFVMSQDAFLFEVIEAASPAIFQDMMRILTHTADFPWVLGLFGILWSVGHAAKKVLLLGLGRTCVITLLLVRAIVEPAKWLIGRARPAISAGLEPLFVGPASSDDFHAFPSGHAASAFGVATGVAGLFPKYRHIAWIWAWLICLSRVVLGRHFVADVIAGGILGYCGGYAVMDFYKSRKIQP